MTGEDADHVQAIAEAVADVLAEHGLVVYAGPSPSARILKVIEVSLLLGRSAPWVYEHAAELGAIRIGNGPEARLGFDLSTIEHGSANTRLGRRRPGSRRGAIRAEARFRAAAT